MSYSCPICFELFDVSDVIATACGHLFHNKCICKWLETSEICPECRSIVKINENLKLRFDTQQDDTVATREYVIKEIESTTAKLKQDRRDLVEMRIYMHGLLKEIQEERELYDISNRQSTSSGRELKFARQKLKRLLSEVSILNRNVSLAKLYVKSFNYMQQALKNSKKEAEDLLQAQCVSGQQVDGQVKEIANFCSVLKCELKKVKAQNKRSEKKEPELLHALDLRNSKLKEFRHSVKDLRKQLKMAKASQVVSNSADSASKSTKGVKAELGKSKPKRKACSTSKQVGIVSLKPKVGRRGAC